MELRKATTNTSGQNNYAHSHEVCPPESVYTCLRGRETWHCEPQTNSCIARASQKTKSTLIVCALASLSCSAIWEHVQRYLRAAQHGKRIGTRRYYYEKLCVCGFFLVTQQLHPTPLVRILPPDPLLVECLILQGSHLNTFICNTIPSIDLSIRALCKAYLYF